MHPYYGSTLYVLWSKIVCLALLSQVRLGLLKMGHRVDPWWVVTCVDAFHASPTKKTAQASQILQTDDCCLLIFINRSDFTTRNELYRNNSSWWIYFINHSWALQRKLYRLIDYSSVKKSGQIRPHSEHLRLGYVKLDQFRLGQVRLEQVKLRKVRLSQYKLDYQPPEIWGF